MSVTIENPSSGPRDSDQVRRLSHEEIAMYEDTTPEDAASKRENMLKSQKKQSIWENTDPKYNLSGVFKPLKEDEKGPEK